ncbi:MULTISPECIES: hypothetical protein [Caballeronia]|uniref:hypothetical protein n=1 Tax=Caballeronia TaxID=1827195 RepID=UPI00158C9DB9|nr:MULTISPECIES: hypothetical protein [Caballeronia]MCG7401996.1 hypothetical protein [Caballeronia zhejiangensis]MCI1042601.1 hypothetical protein [Caballeronia zhejiangensis]
MLNPLEEALFNALAEIAKWPDVGKRYGQQNIKRYAREQLTYAAGLRESVEPPTLPPLKKRKSKQGEPA